MDPIAAVEAAIGHDFDDPSYLLTALTHSSYIAEHPDVESYERMEFLGDAVLGVITTDLIYAAMEAVPEGGMTKLRATVVDEVTLAEVAGRWAIGPALRLGVGEDRSGGRDRPSILSDAVESTIAAVYLDGGFEAASALVERHWSTIIASRIDGQAEFIDSRSKLQEVLAQQGKLVIFEFDRSGPDHASVFEATAVIDGEPAGQGTGSSKKAAAIDAARSVLESSRFEN